jgi:multiple sugar transport system permease protein
LYIAALSLATLIWLLPAIWTVSLSFRPEAALRRSTAGLLPIPFTLENYRAVLGSSLVPRWFLNSVIVSVGHTALVLAVSSLAAFAFARIPFKGRRFVFPVVLAGLMVPGQVTFIPIYLLIADLGWHNTYQALMLPGVAAPFGLFLLTQFFKAIPRDIEEAAMLDGASRLTILIRVMLPLSTPALATLGIITFLGSWNDFLWPLISATRPEAQTITVGLPLLTGNWGPVQFLGRTMAAAWAGGAPVLLVFLLFQRHLIRGMSLGDSF